MVNSGAITFGVISWYMILAEHEEGLLKQHILDHLHSVSLRAFEFAGFVQLNGKLEVGELLLDNVVQGDRRL